MKDRRFIKQRTHAFIVVFESPTVPLAMSLARTVGRVAAVMPKAVVPAPQRAISTSAIARGGHSEMFTPEKYNPLGAPREFCLLSAAM